MVPKLNVYDMASKGVNVTKSPLHLEDGELTKAQNWQTDPTMADGAIRRRDGTGKLNSTALAGAVKGLITLPYPDEFALTTTFYAPIDDVSSNTWRISTTGAAASWSTITDATLRKAQTEKHAASFAPFGTVFKGLVTWAAMDHKIYFPGDDYNSSIEPGTPDTSPTLYRWDGTTAVKLGVVPPSPATLPNLAAGILSIVPYSATELILGVFGRDTGSLYHGSVLLYDLLTGTMTQLGPETSLPRMLVYAPYVYQGRIWIAPAFTGTTATFNIMWCRPGDAAWTVDAAFHTSDVGGTTMVEFLGDLYLGTQSSVGAVAIIRKRTAATGAWSTVKSTDGSGSNQYIGPFIVTADLTTCLAYYNTGNGTAPVIRILSSTDGTTWITDLDVAADLGVNYVVSGIPYLASDGSVYWTLSPSNGLPSVIKRRTSAGVWSTVDTVNSLRGPILPLKVVVP